MFVIYQYDICHAYYRLKTSKLNWDTSSLSLFHPNAWMEVLNFIYISMFWLHAPRMDWHQWWIGLFGEHIISAIVHCYTQILQCPDLITEDKNSNEHPIQWGSCQSLQGPGSQTSRCCIWRFYGKNVKVSNMRLQWPENAIPRMYESYDCYLIGVLQIHSWNMCNIWKVCTW